MSLRKIMAEEGFEFGRAKQFEIATTTIEIDFGGEKRPIVVVQRRGMERMAFYRSTGTGGYSSAGNWVPFFGIADLAEKDVPWLGHVWFVKWETKVPAEGTEEYEIVRELQRLDGLGKLDPERTITAPGRYQPRQGATIQQIRDTYDACAELNNWLQYHRAMRESAKWANGRPFIGYMGSDSDWKSWSPDMTSYLKPLLKKSGLRLPDVLGMTLKELDTAAGVSSYDSLEAWRLARR